MIGIGLSIWYKALMGSVLVLLVQLLIFMVVRYSGLSQRPILRRFLVWAKSALTDFGRR